ncbi:TATA box-binding protein-like protein 1 [Chelonus insularis]|uniref:TATA box-binding protein-like protein 1 n=1 Tax=Chelonus insularis TaxID=460826 RepID=UPI001589720C|nr:TATA box-binding protein-like protein 1 [Chelonus insularis]XP_034947861.1 TATA box-binding protein-like protein 1 [Chelonus insularis]
MESLKEKVDDVPMDDDLVTSEEVNLKKVEGPMDDNLVTSKEVNVKKINDDPMDDDLVTSEEVNLKKVDDGPMDDNPVTSKEVSLETNDDLLIIDDQVTSEKVNLDIVIHNITATFRVGNIIDFKKVPPKYIAVSNCRKIQLKIDDCTIVIQHSGKSLCMGASSEDQALTASRKSINMLKSWGFDVTFSEFKISCFFCTCLLPWRIQIEAMVTKYFNDFTYEPELNNYCTLTIKKGEGFLGVFPTGFIRVISPTVEMILNNLEKALPILSEFRI